MVIAVIALALTGPIPAYARAPGVTPPLRHEPPHQVTLITGDVVTFVDATSFSVDPAPRPHGREVTFTGRSGATIATSKDFYVLPSDVEGDPRLDRELFNVTGLVREGLDRARSLPVLVRGLPKTRDARVLKGNGLAALKVDPKAGFWRDLPRDGKVWLNHRRKVALDQSVAQIGAPQAWAAGLDGTGVTVAVIDTGIDRAHPDLADRVVAEQNFAVDDPDASDHFGHGTHVASTIAGSGAASGGKYKGVAPGAKLINAKACSADGYCFDDWIMAAMDYAAHSGAKVVNMSLGGGISDGTDPLSLEVDRLTKETGVLFVIAAGNSGESGSVTVGSPGAAQSALTVGAVDKQDRLAPFSSRGPRFGDAGIKPDLTAPGVDIVAARAAGTAMGEPVGEHYTRANGTSMATPHVAGAAAILAQQHPGWKAGTLKDSLISTARAVGTKTIDGGAGRVDVARAFTATIVGPSTVDFGRLPRVAIKFRKLTYHNSSAADVTLNLAVTGEGWNGSRSGFTVSPRIRVPARGSADAYLIVNTLVGAAGAYSGIVTATAAGVSLRTPVSYYVVPPTHTLTVKSPSPAYIMRDDFDPARNNDPFAQIFFFGPSADVPVGTYSVLGTQYVTSLTHRPRWTAMSKVDIAVRRDTVVQLDPAAAVPVGAESDAVARVHNVSFSRTVPGGVSLVTGCSCLNADAYATPTPAPRGGTLSLQDTWTFAQRTTSFGTLQPVHDPHAVSAAFPGRQSIPVAWVDSSYEGVAGKVALVGIKVPPDSQDPWQDAFSAGYAAAQQAAAAGAVAIAAFVDVDGAVAQPNLSGAIPYLALSRAEGLALKASGTLDVDTKAHPAFFYNLHYSVPNGIPSPFRHVVDPSRLHRVDSEYHADKPGFTVRRSFVAFRRGAAGTMINPVVSMPARVTVAEYVGGSPDALSNVDWTRIATLIDGNRNQLTMFNRLPFTGRDVWFAGPSSPGSFDPNYVGFLRFGPPGGQMYLRPSAYMGDGSPGHMVDTNFYGYHATAYRLFRDGTEVPAQQSRYDSVPYFPVPDEASSYRLDAHTVLPASGLGGPTLAVRRLSPVVDTSWTFRSQRRDPQPCAPYVCQFETLLQPLYDLGLNLSNNAPAGKAHTIGVSVAGASGLTVSYSGDQGVTWQTATVVNGRFTVSNPASGYVWLRVQAWTATGDRVTQTVQRAYGIG